MKRYLLYLLCAMPLALISCDDNNDLPPVDITVTVSGCTVVDNTIYVVQSEGFTIDSINLINHGDKKAIIGAASYFWDYAHVGSTPENPFSFRFIIPQDQVGRHLLQVECSIYAVDYSPAIGLLSYDITVVESAEDIPGGAAPEGTTYDLTAQVKVNDSTTSH